MFINNLACTTQINPQLYQYLKENNEVIEIKQSCFFDQDKINRELQIPNKFSNDWDTLKNEKKAGKMKYENRDQHPIFDDLFKHLTKDSQFDVYKEQWNFFHDNKSRPDFVFIAKQTPVRPYNCPFIVELQLGKIDDEHKCRVLYYNRYVLDSIPWRSQIISAVSDLDKLILIQTKRDENGDLKHFVTNEISFWNEGIYTLNYMIHNCDQVGFDLSMNISGDVYDKKCFISKFLGKRSFTSESK